MPSTASLNASNNGLDLDKMLSNLRKKNQLIALNKIMALVESTNDYLETQFQSMAKSKCRLSTSVPPDCEPMPPIGSLYGCWLTGDQADTCCGAHSGKQACMTASVVMGFPRSQP